MRFIFDYFRYLMVDLRLTTQVRRNYYRDARFYCIDRALRSKYIFRNPYRISKRYLKRHHAKDLHTYGETPLTTFDRIAKQLDIKPCDRILELGCGRGRGAFFLAHFYNCNVFGIERIPQFVKLAKHIAKSFNIKNVSFECADMFDMQWPDADIIYLYGTCLEDAEIQRLVNRFKTLPRGTRILSTSYPLMEYDSEHTFKIEKSFTLSFPWGETEAFINIYE